MLCTRLGALDCRFVLAKRSVFHNGKGLMSDSAVKLGRTAHRTRQNLDSHNSIPKTETSPYWSTSTKTTDRKRMSADQERTYSKKVRNSCSLNVQTARINGPTGLLKLVACELGLHELTLSQPTPNISSDISCELVDGGKTTLNKPLELGIKWLKLYFDGDKSALLSVRPPLCPHIFNYDSFRSSVWCTLEKHVQFGDITSYGELARLSGSAGASQAVGSAMRNNPVSLIVPCHRVILASGKTGNYAGGKMNETKVWLLEHERQHEL